MTTSRRTDPKHIARLSRVVELRQQGASYDQIGADIGLSRERARQLYAETHRPFDDSLSIADAIGGDLSDDVTALRQHGEPYVAMVLDAIREQLPAAPPNPATITCPRCGARPGRTCVWGSQNKRWGRYHRSRISRC